MKISSSVLAIGLLAAAAKASPVGNENLTKKAVGELVRGVNLGQYVCFKLRYKVIDDNVPKRRLAFA